MSYHKHYQSPLPILRAPGWPWQAGGLLGTLFHLLQGPNVAKYRHTENPKENAARGIVQPAVESALVRSPPSEFPVLLSVPNSVVQGTRECVVTSAVAA